MYVYIYIYIQLQLCKHPNELKMDTEVCEYMFRILKYPKHAFKTVLCRVLEISNIYSTATKFRNINASVDFVNNFAPIWNLEKNCHRFMDSNSILQIPTA